MRAISVASLLLGAASAISHNCRFASEYSQADLLRNPAIREEFLLTALSWEAKFVRELGIDKRSGLTLDGQQLDVDTGLPYGEPHLFTASSKESIHLSLLAKALQGDKFGSVFYTVQEALDMATRVITSYEQFASTYPGYGGFLPWIAVHPTNVTPTWDWTTGVPALDNGQLFWASYGLSRVLEEKHPEQVDLIARWNAFWQTMAANSVKVFYAGEGKIRSVSHIPDIHKSVDENEYTMPEGSHCDIFDNPCYLDDPYEGELFAVMMYLYAPMNQTEKEKIWLGKRYKLQAVDYYVKEINQYVTTQKGWWFSAHEQWKYLFLPYFASPINKQVFLNGEKVRTWDARQKGYPGMFASVTATISSNDQHLDYWSACGVPEAAYERVDHVNVVTPYSTMPVFLADEGVGAVWYHNMISGPAGQTRYGSIEALMTNGSEISPMTTWDSKITTVIGMMGGISDIISRKMMADKVFQPFVDKVELEWGLVFGNITDEGAGFGLPSTTIPHARADFTTCTNSGLAKFL